jgi:glycine/D-amino acid oxidase-like deaminating enzyme
VSRGAGTSTASHRRVYTDQPNRSPWIAQLAEDPPPQPLDRSRTADVVVVGAGIAGIATAFFVLRETDRSVMLLERDRVARGATGRNAGSLSAYFERPLCEIASEFGPRAAGVAQQFLEDAHVLLDLMVDEAGADVRVERVTGHMGMFNRNHLDVHLRCLQVRKQTGLAPISIVVSEDAEFLDDLPAEYAGLFSVVPQSTVRKLLEVQDDRYRAVLSAPEGSANSGLLCQQVLAYLQDAYADRFVYADRTNVERIVVEEGQSTVFAGRHRVTADRVVLCTNGFVDHTVEDGAGAPIRLAPDQQIVGRVGYLTAILEDEPCQPAAISYIRNTVIGGDTPYAYVARRMYDHAGGTATLTCLGGPEYPFDDAVYDAEAPFPGALLQIVDEVVRPFARGARRPGQPYDFHWHGLMGYNESRIRVIGAHPRHERVLYNLGCNGVGFLASIGGGRRIAELLAGRRVEPSIFDPR